MSVVDQAMSYLADAVPDAIVVGNVSFGDKTVSAGSTASLSASAAKTGYTPIGVVGVTMAGSGNGLLSVSHFQISSSSVLVVLNNNSSASRTGTNITATVLYKKQV